MNIYSPLMFRCMDTVNGCSCQRKGLQDISERLWPVCRLPCTGSSHFHQPGGVSFCQIRLYGETLDLGAHSSAEHPKRASPQKRSAQLIFFAVSTCSSCRNASNSYSYLARQAHPQLGHHVARGVHCAPATGQHQGSSWAQAIVALKLETHYLLPMSRVHCYSLRCNTSQNIRKLPHGPGAALILST